MKLHTILASIIIAVNAGLFFSVSQSSEFQVEIKITNDSYQNSFNQALIAELKTLFEKAVANTISQDEFKNGMQEFTHKLKQTKISMDEAQKIVSIFKENIEKLSHYDTEMIEEILFFETFLGGLVALLFARVSIAPINEELLRDLSFAEVTKTCFCLIGSAITAKIAYAFGKRTIQALKQLPFYVKRYIKERALYRQALALEKNIQQVLLERPV